MIQWMTWWYQIVFQFEMKQIHRPKADEKKNENFHSLTVWESESRIYYSFKTWSKTRQRLAWATVWESVRIRMHEDVERLVGLDCAKALSYVNDKAFAQSMG